MSTTGIAFERTGVVTRMGSFLELTRPRIGVMILVTVGVSAFVARWGIENPWLVLHAMLGTVMVAASASAVNQWIERRRDSLMPRTADRPLPSGRVTPSQVLLFGGALLVGGLLYLSLAVSVVTASLGLLTWLLYVLAYTPLKPVTHLNTLVGAVPGAMPVLVGWSASGASLLDIRAAALFLLVFVWQFPHFMAIAWLYRKQYAAAGHKMLTVVDPTGRRAGVQAVLCAVALLPISYMPVMQVPQPYVYLTLALLLGTGQLACAGAFLWRMNDTTARWLLRASLIYLPAMLALLMLSPLL